MVFKRKEIVYDLENYSFVEADLMEESHNRHLVFDIAQDGNANRVTRVLNLAVSEVVEQLYPYTKEEIPDDAKDTDDILTEPEEYEIALMLPDGFSQTTVNLLNQLIHEYLVYRVLSDWLTIVKPDSAPVWLAKLEDIKNQIKTALHIRRGRTRRKMTPF